MNNKNDIHNQNKKKRQRKYRQGHESNLKTMAKISNNNRKTTGNKKKRISRRITSAGIIISTRKKTESLYRYTCANPETNTITKSFMETKLTWQESKHGDHKE